MSQPPTLVLIAAIVVVRGVRVAPGPWILYGVAAGLVGLVGLGAAYRGMAIGVVSVVSTIAATGPVIPLVVGLLLGERPKVLQFGGMAMALGGVVLLSFDRRPAGGRRLVPGVGFALLAALAFGLFLVAIRYASRPDALYAVLATRAGSVAALLILGGIFRLRLKGPHPALPGKPGRELQVSLSDVPALIAVGVLDIGADVFFAFATRLGLLSIVSILSSLYPVATVLLALVVLQERMARLQQAGVVLALAGVGAISV